MATYCDVGGVPMHQRYDTAIFCCEFFCGVYDRSLIMWLQGYSMQN